MKSATEGVNKALGNLDTATPRELERLFSHLNKQLKRYDARFRSVAVTRRANYKYWKERLADIRDELKAAGVMVG